MDPQTLATIGALIDKARQELSTITAPGSTPDQQQAAARNLSAVLQLATQLDTAATTLLSSQHNLAALDGQINAQLALMG